MTTEEKRMNLTMFCSARQCNRCPLRKGFKCGDGTSFMKKDAYGNYTMADKTIDKAYEIAIEKKKGLAPPVKKETPTISVAKAHRKPASAYHNCPHNCGLQCDSPESACAKCGWFPAERERRAEMLQDDDCVKRDRLGLLSLRIKRVTPHE